MATPFEIETNESSSQLYSVTLNDEDGNVVTSVSISSITMTVIETLSGDTVNSRSNQDIFNANNCTFHATSGLFTWNIQPDDTAIVNTNTPVQKKETHLATITFKWASNTKEWHREIALKCLNLRSVPQS